MKANWIETDIEVNQFTEERRPYIPGAIAAWNRASGAEPMPDDMDEDDRIIAFLMFASGYYAARTESCPSCGR